MNSLFFWQSITQTILKVSLMQLTLVYPSTWIFLCNISTKGKYQYRIIGRGNRKPADKPYQNQIELLMGASFILLILLCIHPLKYWCLNKTCDFRERNLHELYSILTWRWWEVCVNYFSGVDHGILDQGASLLTSNPLSSAMDSQSRIKGVYKLLLLLSFFCSIFLCNYSITMYILCSSHW